MNEPQTMTMKKATEQESLAQFVKRVRKEKGFSLSQVAANSGDGVTDGHVSRIENGFTDNLTAEIIRSLADGLQVSPMALCERIFSLKAAVNPIEEEILLHLRSMPELAKAHLLLIARAFRQDDGVEKAK